MKAAAPRLAPIVLVLIVCAGHALASRSGERAAPRGPAVAAELVLPGLFAHDGAAGTWPFDAPAPPATRSLVWAALAAGASATPIPRAAPYVGLIPLWLALAALLTAGSSRRSLVAAALLVLVLAAGVLLDQPWAIVAALALSAAVGLRRIRADEAGAEVRPQLVAAACCVAMTAALIAASLRTGFATDAQALQPLLARLDVAARGAWDPVSLALEASHLRAVLDRAALAAFAGMTALLLHLKSRARWSAALLLAVTAADVGSAAL